MMTLMQGAAVLVLWRSGHFDTLQIAELLGLDEADVGLVIHAAREAERSPDWSVAQ